MYKPNGNFKLSKTSKRFLATIVNSNQKGMLKAGLIQAELAAAIVPKREPKREGKGAPQDYTGSSAE